MYLVNTLRPLAAASPFKNGGSFERDNRGTLFSHAYVTVEEVATAVARFVLNPIPADRDPLSTLVAHRILSWDGEGEVVFPMADTTTVAVMQATYDDLVYLCGMSLRELRVLGGTDEDLIKEFNLRMGPTKK